MYRNKEINGKGVYKVLADVVDNLGGGSGGGEKKKKKERVSRVGVEEKPICLGPRDEMGDNHGSWIGATSTTNFTINTATGTKEKKGRRWALLTNVRRGSNFFEFLDDPRFFAYFCLFVSFVCFMFFVLSWRNNFKFIVKRVSMI